MREMSNITLLNIDCMTYMKDCEDSAFDLAICDPPYGIGVNHSMGRRRGQQASGYAPAVWDKEPPSPEYFDLLQRKAKKLIIWGANHFIDNFPFMCNSSCWVMWDKGFSEDVTFAQFELAWTNFDTTCKKYDKSPNDKFRIHPTQKPVKLYEWLLTNYAEKGQRILDTHLGSASSAIAAHYFGCEFVGCEIDKDYFDAASERFNRETRQVALF